MAAPRTSLVTGAAGFLGTHLVEQLLEAGDRVVASDRPGQDVSWLEARGVEVLRADVREPGALEPLFDRHIDRVFHLAAVCNFSTPYERLFPINVTGVAHITRLAREAGVERFVHISSTAVYGLPNGAPLTEESPRRPAEAYGRSKRDGENIVLGAIRDGLPATILRPCTVYGPRCTDGAGKAFSRPTSIAAIPGHGRQRLSNVRAEDVAAAAIHLAGIDAAAGEAYNIAEPGHPMLGDALRLAAATFGASPPRLRLPLRLVAALALVDGAVARLRGSIPDLETDAVRYLGGDYLVDAGKLAGTGFRFRFPDFERSMADMRERQPAA